FDNSGKVYADTLTIKGEGALNNDSEILGNTLEVAMASLNNADHIQATLLSLSGKDVSNLADGRIIAESGNIAISGALLNQGEIYSKTELVSTSASLHNLGLINVNTLKAKVSGELRNGGNILIAGSENTLEAAQFVNLDAGRILANQDMLLGFGEYLDNRGVITSAGKLTLAGLNLNNQAGAELASATELDGSAIEGKITNAGRIGAG
ncbi:MAG: hypothetical protein OIF38_04450, partial [Cellvibrionaceae bacterium]|nr:hypothetical protein [Cellvibrionaceae bacterium]